MINIDGVSNGNYRHDNNLKNLNREYGLGNFQSTPQIKAIQILINHYKSYTIQRGILNIGGQNKLSQNQNVKIDNLLLFYFDVHSHQSAKSSFLFGNFNQNLEHKIENKLFCKLIEKNMGRNCFKQTQCNFDKENLNIKQKYDENTKHHTGRAFSGLKLDNKNFNRQTFHSYTLEINSFLLSNQLKKANLNCKDPIDEQKRVNQNKIQNLVDFSKSLARQILKGIANIVGFFNEPQSKKQVSQLRVLYCKQMTRQLNKQRKSILDLKNAEKWSDQIKLINKLIQQNQKQYLQNIYFTKSNLKGLSQNKNRLFAQQKQKYFKNHGLFRVRNKLQLQQVNQQFAEGQKSIERREIRFSKPRQNKSQKKSQNLSIGLMRRQIFKSLKRHKDQSFDQQYKNQILQKIEKVNQNYKISKIVIGNDNSLCLQGGEDEQQLQINNTSSIIHCIKNQKPRKPKLRIKTQGRDYNQLQSTREINSQAMIHSQALDNFKTIQQRFSYNVNTCKSIQSIGPVVQTSPIDSFLQNIIEFKRRIKQITPKHSNSIQHSSSSTTTNQNYQKIRFSTLNDSAEQDSRKYKLSYQIRQMSKNLSKIKQEQMHGNQIQNKIFPQINIKPIKRQMQSSKQVNNKSQTIDRNRLIQKNKYCSIQAVRQTIKKRRMEIIDVERLKKNNKNQRQKPNKDQRQKPSRLEQLKKYSHSPNPFKDDKLINLFIRKQSNH